MEKTQNNYWMLAAAGLIAATGFIHIYGGGPEYMTPMLATDLANIPKTGFTVIWHIITLTLFGSAAALWWLNRHRNTALFVTVIGFLMISSVIFLWVGVSETSGIFDLPQWILLGGPAMVALIGWFR